MIDHDRLFKELLSTFFVEFIQLFLPKVFAYLEPDSITFLNQEIFTDLTSGERREVDLLAKIRFQGQDTCFLIHLENQSKAQTDFARRMFHYFARLDEKYRLTVYPVVIFSFDAPQRLELSHYQVQFPDRKILDFNYAAIQLNRLNWRDFLQQRNPVAAALMAKMRIAPEDRPKVKAECLRLLATLRLDPARMQLISGFVDVYLKLNAVEEQTFQAEIDKMGLTEREQVMEIVTSWMEQGIQQGIQQGEVSMVLRQLHRRLSSFNPRLEAQIRNLPTQQVEELGEALLDFSDEIDLINWLNQEQ
jgi:predicted transposase/invertase (TIGR01784 family)